MGGEWICLGVVDLLGIISFFLLSLVVRKLVVGYLKDTNAGECLKRYKNLEKKNLLSDLTSSSTGRLQDGDGGNPAMS